MREGAQFSVPILGSDPQELHLRGICLELNWTQNTRPTPTLELSLSYYWGGGSSNSASHRQPFLITLALSPDEELYLSSQFINRIMYCCVLVFSLTSSLAQFPSTLSPGQLSMYCHSTPNSSIFACPVIMEVGFAKCFSFASSTMLSLCQ